MTKQNVFPRVAAVLGCVVFLSSCLNDPINAHTAGKYYDLALREETNGNLRQARIFYSRSYLNTQLGHQPPESQAHALFEWTRVSGYLGYYAEADEGYVNVLALVAKSDGRADSLLAPIDCERARLLRDSCQDQRAIPVYVQAVQQLEKVGVDRTMPLLFAEFLDDYEQALRIASRPTEADQMAARTRDIRSAHPGPTPVYPGAINFQRAGRSAQQRNDWYAASINYWRALREVSLRHAKPRSQAVMNYEYGRSLGAMGRFKESADYLLRALQFDRDAGGELYFDFNELARLNFDQRRFAEANDYFQPGLAEMDRVNLSDKLPSDYIDLLLEFAVSLRATDRIADAERIDDRIAELRRLHPAGKSNTDRTPYGKYPPTGLVPPDPGPRINPPS